MPETLLELRGLTVAFGGGGGFGKRVPRFVALDSVDLAVARGEVFGLVGESGAGKSTLVRCVAGLQRPTEGEMLVDGQPFASSASRYSLGIQMVFQDPNSSLNPRMTVGEMLSEPLRVHGLVADRGQARDRAGELLELVGLPRGALERRPRHFSGGQRQRVAIARAIALEPSLLLADEAVSSLDVSVQASILSLLKELQRELGLTILFISHDLGVVHQFCDRVGVMKDGKLVETGDIEAVFHEPSHPYTRELLAAATTLPPLEVEPAVAARTRSRALPGPA